MTENNILSLGNESNVTTSSNNTLSSLKTKYELINNKVAVALGGRCHLKKPRIDDVEYNIEEVEDCHDINKCVPFSTLALLDLSCDNNCYFMNLKLIFDYINSHKDDIFELEVGHMIYKKRHDYLLRRVLTMVGLEFEEERSFRTVLGINSDKTPDFIDVQDNKILIIEFTASSRFENIIENKGLGEYTKYTSEINQLKGLGYDVNFVQLYIDFSDTSNTFLKNELKKLNEDENIIENYTRFLDEFRNYARPFSKPLHMIYSKYCTYVNYIDKDVSLNNLDHIFKFYKEDKADKLPPSQSGINIVDRNSIVKKITDKRELLKEMKSSLLSEMKYKLLYDEELNCFVFDIDDEGYSTDVYMNLINQQKWETLSEYTFYSNQKNVTSRSLILVNSNSSVTYNVATAVEERCCDYVFDYFRDMDDNYKGSHKLRDIYRLCRSKVPLQDIYDYDIQEAIKLFTSRYKGIKNTSNAGFMQFLCESGMHDSLCLSKTLDISQRVADMKQAYATSTADLRLPKAPFIMHLCTVKPTLKDYRPNKSLCNTISMSPAMAPYTFTVTVLRQIVKKYDELPSGVMTNEVVDKRVIDIKNLKNELRSIIMKHGNGDSMCKQLENVSGDYRKLNINHPEYKNKVENLYKLIDELKKSETMIKKKLKIRTKKYRCVKVVNKGNKTNPELFPEEELQYGSRGIPYNEDNCNIAADWYKDVSNYLMEDDEANNIDENIKHDDILVPYNPEPLNKKCIMNRFYCVAKFNQDLARCVSTMSTVSLSSDLVYCDNLGREGVIVLIKGGKGINSTGNSRLFKVIFEFNPRLKQCYPSKTSVMINIGEKCYVMTRWLDYNKLLLEHMNQAGTLYANMLVGNRCLFSRCPELCDSLIRLKSMLLLSSKRYIEKALHDLRYIVVNSFNEYSFFLDILKEKLMVPCRDILYLYIISTVLSNVAKFKDEANTGRICYLFDTNIVVPMDIMSNTFILNSIMPKAAVNPKTSLGNDIKSVLDEHVSISQDLGINSNFTHQEYVNKTEFKIKDFLRNLHTKGNKYVNGFYSPEYSNIMGQILRAYIKNGDIDLNNEWVKIMSSSCTNISNNKGLRGDDPKKKDYRGKKGSQVVYDKIKVLNDEIQNLFNDIESLDKKDMFSIRKIIMDNNVTFYDVTVDSSSKMGLGFYITYKIQHGGDREIYVMHVSTKMRQYPLEKFFQKVAELVDNEMINVSSDQRRNKIHRDLFESETTDENIYFVLDCRRWGPRSNFNKYIHMILACRDVLPADFMSAFIDFSNSMMDKRTYFDKHIFELITKGLKENEKEKYCFVQEIKDDNGEDTGVCGFLHPYSFMMGIFNYLSSIYHACSQQFYKLVVKEMLGLQVDMFAHSDDAAGILRYNKMKINKVLFNKLKANSASNDDIRDYITMSSIYFLELITNVANTELSRKKVSIGMKIFEFLSIFYYNKVNMNVAVKFIDNCKMSYTNKGLIEDINFCCSKGTELLRNGADIYSADYCRATLLKQTYMTYGVDISDNELLPNVPFGIGGPPRMSSWTHLLTGTDCEFIRLEVKSEYYKDAKCTSMLKTLSEFCNDLITDMHDESVNPIRYIIPAKYHESGLEARNSVELKLAANKKANVLVSYNNYLLSLKDSSFINSLDNTDQFKVYMNTLSRSKQCVYRYSNEIPPCTIHSILIIAANITKKSSLLDENDILMYKKFYLTVMYNRLKDYALECCKNGMYRQYQCASFNKTELPTKPCTNNYSVKNITGVEELRVDSWVAYKGNALASYISNGYYNERDIALIVKLMNELKLSEAAIDKQVRAMTKYQNTARVHLNLVCRRSGIRTANDFKTHIASATQNMLSGYSLMNIQYPLERNCYLFSPLTLENSIGNDTKVLHDYMNMLQDLSRHYQKETTTIFAELLNKTTEEYLSKCENKKMLTDLARDTIDSIRRSYSNNFSIGTNECKIFYHITHSINTTINKQVETMELHVRYGPISAYVVSKESVFVYGIIQCTTDDHYIRSAFTDYLVNVMVRQGISIDKILTSRKTMTRQLVWGYSPIDNTWGWHASADCTLKLRNTKKTEIVRFKMITTQLCFDHGSYYFKRNQKTSTTNFRFMPRENDDYYFHENIPSVLKEHSKLTTDTTKTTLSSAIAHSGVCKRLSKEIITVDSSKKISIPKMDNLSDYYGEIMNANSYGLRMELNRDINKNVQIINQFYNNIILAQHMTQSEKEDCQKDYKRFMETETLEDLQKFLYKWSRQGIACAGLVLLDTKLNINKAIGLYSNFQFQTVCSDTFFAALNEGNFIQDCVNDLLKGCVTFKKFTIPEAYYIHHLPAIQMQYIVLTNSTVELQNRVVERLRKSNDVYASSLISFCNAPDQTFRNMVLTAMDLHYNKQILGSEQRGRGADAYKSYFNEHEKNHAIFTRLCNQIYRERTFKKGKFNIKLSKTHNFCWRGDRDTLMQKLDLVDLYFKGYNIRLDEIYDLTTQSMSSPFKWIYCHHATFSVNVNILTDLFLYCRINNPQLYSLYTSKDTIISDLEAYNDTFEKIDPIVINNTLMVLEDKIKKMIDDGVQPDMRNEIILTLRVRKFNKQDINLPGCVLQGPRMINLDFSNDKYGLDGLEDLSDAYSEYITEMKDGDMNPFMVTDLGRKTDRIRICYDAQTFSSFVSDVPIIFSYTPTFAPWLTNFSTLVNVNDNDREKKMVVYCACLSRDKSFLSNHLITQLGFKYYHDDRILPWGLKPPYIDMVLVEEAEKRDSTDRIRDYVKSTMAAISRSIGLSKPRIKTRVDKESKKSESSHAAAVNDNDCEEESINEEAEDTVSSLEELSQNTTDKAKDDILILHDDLKHMYDILESKVNGNLGKTKDKTAEALIERKRHATAQSRHNAADNLSSALLNMLTQSDFLTSLLMTAGNDAMPGTINPKNKIYFETKMADRIWPGPEHEVSLMMAKTMLERLATKTLMLRVDTCKMVINSVNLYLNYIKTLSDKGGDAMPARGTEERRQMMREYTKAVFLLNIIGNSYLIDIDEPGEFDIFLAQEADRTYKNVPSVQSVDIIEELCIDQAEDYHYFGKPIEEVRDRVRQYLSNHDGNNEQDGSNNNDNRDSNDNS